MGTSLPPRGDSGVTPFQLGSPPPLQGAVRGPPRAWPQGPGLQAWPPEYGRWWKRSGGHCFRDPLLCWGARSVQSGVLAARAGLAGQVAPKPRGWGQSEGGRLAGRSSRSRKGRWGRGGVGGRWLGLWTMGSAWSWGTLRAGRQPRETEMNSRHHLCLRSASRLALARSSVGWDSIYSLVPHPPSRKAEALLRSP